jgi:hypothetical protein
MKLKLTNHMAVMVVAAIGVSSVLGADVQMRIEPMDLEVSLHEPVVARVTVTNSGEKSIRVDFGVDFLEGFRLSVTRPDGQRHVLPPLAPREGLAFGGPVDIADSSSYTRVLILNEWLGFDAPGLYRVEVGLTGVPNIAVVTIMVLPRDSGRLARVSTELADKALRATSFDEALLITKALSFALGTEAVPHLKRVAVENDGLAPIAVDGLARIADRAAVEALHALSRSLSKELSALARGRLGVVRLSTQDVRLQREIDAMLASSKR